MHLACRLVQTPAGGEFPPCLREATRRRRSLMAWRLVVIDGADQGRLFPLPETGTILVGSSRKHADVCLNDLYVARVHCHVEVTNDRVIVKHAEGSHETLVNGKKVVTHDLRPGEVLRAGNS